MDPVEDILAGLNLNAPGQPELDPQLRALILGLVRALQQQLDEERQARQALQAELDTERQARQAAQDTRSGNGSNASGSPASGTSHPFADVPLGAAAPAAGAASSNTTMAGSSGSSMDLDSAGRNSGMRP